MKVGTIRRMVDDEGSGRLWLIDDNGEAFAVSRRLLRDNDIHRPEVGQRYEFLAHRGAVAQLRRIAE